MYNCLKCGADMDEIVGFDYLCDDFVSCPSCGHKMAIEYDESYDEESGDESYWFWLEDYKEAQQLLQPDPDLCGPTGPLGA